MNELEAKLSLIMERLPVKLVLSKQSSKTGEFRKIDIVKKKDGYRAEKYTKTQVFHQNITAEEAKELCLSMLSGSFLQLNAWDNGREYMILISKNGKVSYKSKATAVSMEISDEHNRTKGYLIPEGKIVPALVDMGVFTAEGKIVNSMYDKYRQINRFLEIIDDGVKNSGQKSWNIVDFGCGKSYLTFILYYYFTEIRGLDVNVIGLDLKREVIENCSAAAVRYGYGKLRFEVGDIKDYKPADRIDMVISLHACDTATDYALYNAIKWDAQMIFSVPCCQHELNSQLKAENLSLYGRYGIIKERMAALSTDAIRANLLEYSGYKTQVLEFVDLSHTPKNLLIRAVKKNNIAEKHRREMLCEAQAVMKEFGFEPTLYRLLGLNDN
ncbi:MAG: SAM-dependent methyltransferase [Oscillospiraceae bacterium]|nr:SAM-dependent methyltransferase [Oscillospiraceae bacterium]